MIQKVKLPGLSSNELTRLIALEILYAIQFNNKTIDENIKDFLHEDTWKINFLDVNKEIYIANINNEYLNFIVKGVYSKYEEITKYLEKILNNSKFKYSPIILQIIVILGIFELKYSCKIEPRVLISQYVFLASLFFDEIQISFVNVILDQAVNNQKKEIENE